MQGLDLAAQAAPAEPWGSVTIAQQAVFSQQAGRKPLQGVDYSPGSFPFLFFSMTVEWTHGNIDLIFALLKRIGSLQVGGS